MSAIKKRPHNPHFKDGVDYTWHTTKDFNDSVKEFRDKYAALPPSMKDARLMHTTIINELMRKLKEKPLRCSRLEYTGSAYEGVKVSKGKDDDDLEFDIMVIIEGGRDLKKENSETPPGYVLLQPSVDSGMRFQRQTTEGYVSADKVASHFMGQLSACIDEIQAEKLDCPDAPEELRHIKYNTILRKHGPAIQMDICRGLSQPLADGDRPKPFYSVDMVPTFEMVFDGSQKEYYVAKPLKGVNFADNPKLKFAWRRSFSLDEKDRLWDMDKNNTCKKAIFRMLKVIRNRECGLALLTSYHLKTVLLRELESRPNDEDWKEEHIGKRLMDVISRLVSELGSETRRPREATAGRRRAKKEPTKRVFQKGLMPHLFIPEINLVDGIDEKAWAPIYYRLKHLKNSKKQVVTIVSGASKPRREKASKAKDKPVAANAKTKTKADRRHFPRGGFSEVLQVQTGLSHLLLNTQHDTVYNDDDDEEDYCDDDYNNEEADNCDVDDCIDYSEMFEDTCDDLGFNSD